MITADKIINLAKNEIGYLEKSKSAYINNPSCIWYKLDGRGYDNINKYAYEIDRTNWYGGMTKNGFPWCACFVDWVFLTACDWDLNEAGRTKYHGIYDAVVDYAIDNYKAAGAWYQEPEKGDQIFFRDWDGDPCHTGIVVDIDDVYVWTVEGNTSSQDGTVESDGGGVFLKHYPLHGYYRIYGYGRPNYGKEDDYMTKAEILKELGDTWIATYDDLPEWAKPDVRWMLDNGIINGGTDYADDPNDINMFLSDIKNIIVAKRLIDAKK